MTENEIIASVVIVAVALLAWIWWPKKKVVEALEEVKNEESPTVAVNVSVNPQITDAVTQAAPAKAKAPAKKTGAPKKTSAAKKTAAPKKAKAKKKKG